MEPDLGQEEEPATSSDVLEAFFPNKLKYTPITTPYTTQNYQIIEEHLRDLLLDDTLQITIPEHSTTPPEPISTTETATTCSPSPRQPPTFSNTLDWRHETFERIETAEMVFYWPASSSPDKYDAFMDAIGGKKSPLRPDRWEFYLKDHPDRVLVDNVLRGLREGFCVGYTKERTTQHCPPRNYSDEDFLQIKEEFDTEVSKGRMQGPFTELPTTGPFSYTRTNPTFLIPKKATDKLRRIDHLSFPEGSSINDGIDKNEFPVNFTDVTKLTDAVLDHPKDTLVSLLDIEDAYRNIPLNPVDVGLFCQCIRNIFYLQLFMCFGGTSFCGIFDTFTMLIIWIILHWATPPGFPNLGITHIEGILDDFTCFHSIFGSIYKPFANLELLHIIFILIDLGLPIKWSKLQLPSVSFLSIGLEWNTVSQTITIPGDKIIRYLKNLKCVQTSIQFSYERPHITTIPRLRSILGQLVYISNIVYVGRTRLFYLFRCLRAAEKRARDELGPPAIRLKSFPGVLNRVYLCSQAQHDLRWWESVLLTMPARSLIRRRHPTSLDDETCIKVTTDASGWGVGGFWTDSNETTFCFSIPWLMYGGEAPHSTYGELFALLVAMAFWDSQWEGRHVIWETDCKCHITGIFKIRTQAPELLPVHDWIDLRCAQGDYTFVPRWIPGEANIYADALSRKCSGEIPPTWRKCHPDTLRLPETFLSKLNV